MNASAALCHAAGRARSCQWTCARRPVHHGAVNYETGRAANVDPSDVETRDDLARFLSSVLADFRSTGEVEWENSTLEQFLDGLAAVAGARVVESAAIDQEEASWRLFAEIVRAATGFE